MFEGEIPTFLLQKIRTAIWVGKLFLPANSLAEYLKRFSAPGLFLSEEHRPHHLTKGGSVSLLRYCGRYYALASFHQFSRDRYDFHQLCISNPERGTLLTPQSVVFPDGGAEHCEDFDCVSLEYTDPVAGKLLPGDIWFDLSISSASEPVEDPLFLLCIGYPSHRNNIDYDTASYSVAPNAVWGTATAPSMSGRRAFVPLRPLGYQPFGMSGSPVFRVDLVGTQLVLSFAGILTEATSTAFNYISIGRIFPNFFASQSAP